MMDNDYRYNPEQPKLVKKWSQSTLQSIKTRYLSMINSKNRSDEGFYSIKIQHREEHGEITRVSFKMARHLVFVHGGYGKGVGGAKGSSWLAENGVRKKTNPRSLGANPGTRRAKAWLNPVLEAETPKLADALLKEKLDSALNAIYLR